MAGNPFSGLDTGSAALDVLGRVRIERLFHDVDPPTIDGKRLGTGKLRIE